MIPDLGRFAGVERAEHEERARSSASAQSIRRSVVMRRAPRSRHPCRPLVLGEGAAEREEAEPDPALHRPERSLGPEGDLLLRQAAEVRKLDRLALWRRQRSDGSPDRLGVEPSGDSGHTSGVVIADGGGNSGSGSSTVGRRRRIASMARWCAMDMIQVRALAFSGAKREAFRQMPTSASCATSWARAASPVMRIASPLIMRWYRS
jgi:hypothetical protein